MIKRARVQGGTSLDSTSVRAPPTSSKLRQTIKNLCQTTTTTMTNPTKFPSYHTTTTTVETSQKKRNRFRVNTPKNRDLKSLRTP
jgi:hypothetical protein